MVERIRVTRWLIYIEHALAIFGAFSLFALIGMAAMLVRSVKFFD